MSESVLYLLTNQYTTPPDPDPNWLRSVMACKHCESMVHGYWTAPLDVVLSDPGFLAPLDCVGDVHVIIVSYDLLLLFEDHLRNWCQLGRVLDAGGTEIPGYVSVVTPHVLNVRGGPESLFGFCRQCGGASYSPIHGPLHVARGDLCEATIYKSPFPPGLIVTSELRERIRSARMRGIDIWKLDIYDEPLDGFPTLPPFMLYAPTPAERAAYGEPERVTPPPAPSPPKRPLPRKRIRGSGQITLNGETVKVTRAALRVPGTEDTRKLELSVGLSPGGEISITSPVLSWVPTVAALDGLRLHQDLARCCVHDDDTVGAAPTNSPFERDLNFCVLREMEWLLGQTCIDFERLEEAIFECRLCVELLDGQDRPAGELSGTVKVLADETESN